MEHFKKKSQILIRSLIISTIVLVFGAAWILFSDHLVNSLFHNNIESIKQFQTYKGLLFISLNSLLIFFLCFVSNYKLFVSSAKLEIRDTQYNDLIDSIPVGIYSTDAQGNITSVNPHLTFLTGLSNKELLSNGWVSIIDEAEQSRVSHARTSALESTGLFYQQYMIHTQDFQHRQIVDIAHPLKNGDDQVIGYMGTLMDVTDVVETELKVKQQDSLIHLFVEYSPTAIAMFDNDLNYIMTSRRWINDYELTDKKIAGRCHYEIFPDLPERWKEIHQRCLKGAIERCEEDRIVRADGKIVWLRWEIHPWKKADGNIGGIIMFTEVITKQKEAELRKAELAEQMKLASEVANIGFFDMDVDTKSIYFSPECKRMIGYEEDEIENDIKTWIGQIHPDDADEVIKVFKAFSKNPEDSSFHLQFRLRHKNGSYRDIYAQGQLVLNNTDEYKRLIGVHVDVSRLKQTEQSLIRYQQRMKHLLTSSPTVLYSLKFDNKKISTSRVSDNILRVLGYTVEEAKSKDWWNRNLHPDDREQVLKQFESSMNKETATFEYRILHKKGYTVYVKDVVRTLRNSEGKITELIGSWTDVSESHEEQEKLQLISTAMENTADGMVITYPNGSIILVNNAFQKITGYSEEELVGKNPRMLQSGQHDRSFYKIMWEQLQKYGQWQGEVWNRRKNGEIYPQFLNINAVYGNDDTNLTHYVGISTDLNPLKLKDKQLDELTHFDPLTRLPNRLLLHSRLDHAIEQAHRSRAMLGLIIIDLDDFKKINDSAGHSIGDELLIEFAGRLNQRLREQDSYGRIGVDTFLLIIEQVKSVDELGTLARDMLELIRVPFNLSTIEKLHVTASLGISLYPNDATSSKELIQHAETAMHRSEQNSGDQFSYFTDEMGIAAKERLKLENDLRFGIERNELLLHYQPKIELRSGKMPNAEALVRWKRSSSELVPPDKFIPIAEKNGLIIPLGNSVIDIACRQLRDWLDQGYIVPAIAVNIAAMQFLKTDLVSIFEQKMNEYGIKPDLLGIEITESTLMAEPEKTIEILNKLKLAGISISLDDFGTGYSNLSYLSRFPIDIIKIDRSFVHHIGEDINASKLITSIIDLAHNMSLRTVAEGVESREQFEFLRNAGCEEIQGYYFSKPLAADEFETLMKEDRTF